MLRRDRRLTPEERQLRKILKARRRRLRWLATMSTETLNLVGWIVTIPGDSETVDAEALCAAAQGARELSPLAIQRIDVVARNLWWLYEGCGPLDFCSWLLERLGVLDPLKMTRQCDPDEWDDLLKGQLLNHIMQPLTTQTFFGKAFDQPDVSPF